MACRQLRLSDWLNLPDRFPIHCVSRWRPARFQLVAAINPCWSGYLGDPSRACGSAPACGRKYAARAYAGLRPQQAADCANSRLQPDQLAEVMLCDDDATLLL